MSDSNNILIHHGILGQKWGVRRYQNPDGTLTAEGRARLGYSEKQAAKDFKKVAKQREGSRVDALARTKTVQQLYKNNRDELTTLHKERKEALAKWKKAYDAEMAKHEGEKHHDYEWEDISWKAELAANKKIASENKKSSGDYLARCKELAKEAFGDYSNVPFSSVNKKNK